MQIMSKASAIMLLLAEYVMLHMFSYIFFLLQEVIELLNLQTLHPATLLSTLTKMTLYMQQAPAAEIAALRDWPAFISLLGMAIC